jgi:hypothetical protein
MMSDVGMIKLPYSLRAKIFVLRLHMNALESELDTYVDGDVDRLRLNLNVAEASCSRFLKIYAKAHGGEL